MTKIMGNWYKIIKLLLDNWKKTMALVAVAGVALGGWNIGLGPFRCEHKKITAAKAVSDVVRPAKR